MEEVDLILVVVEEVDLILVIVEEVNLLLMGVEKVDLISRDSSSSSLAPLRPQGRRCRCCWRAPSAPAPKLFRHGWYPRDASLPGGSRDLFVSGEEPRSRDGVVVAFNWSEWLFQGR